MSNFPRCRRATWADVDGWVAQLNRRVRDADRIPATIVALTRGGWAPARLLSDRLGVKRIAALRTQHWGVTAMPSGRAELTEGLSAPVTGEDVLVVDDITDTGESLSLAVQHVREDGARRIESATCLHITHSKFVPTYYAETIEASAWTWVVFPWTYWEDVRTLAGRAYDEVHDVRAAREILRERCGLSVPLRDVQRALKDRLPTT